MMLAFVLGFSASAAASAPLIAGDRLADTFVAACLDGEALLSPGEMSAVGIGSLPSNLRKKLGKPASGEVWRLSTSGRSYLYVLNYAPGGKHDTKICGLASDEMSLDLARTAVDMRMNGYVGAEKLTELQWLMPRDGYVATVAREGAFNVAQINWLSEAGRAEIAREVDQIQP